MEALMFILWLAAIAACAIICENKGRTVWKGVVAGIGLGWIGVIICACLQNKSDE